MSKKVSNVHTYYIFKDDMFGYVLFDRITKGIGSKYVCAYLDIEKLLITKVYTGILSGSMCVEEFQTGVQQKCCIC